MIRFNNVDFSYGNREILKNFCLTVDSSEKVCLFAPSGYGKTTVLRLIMGLEKCTSGKIEGLVDKKISAVFQEDRLLPHKSVCDNVSLFGDRERAREILTQLALQDAAELYPSQLSGGMSRRVAIARALCRSADIYIFDEPFNGIDAENIEKTAQCIIKETKDKTVLLVTHDLRQAEILGAKVIDLESTEC